MLGQADRLPVDVHVLVWIVERKAAVRVAVFSCRDVVDQVVAVTISTVW